MILPADKAYYRKIDRTDMLGFLEEFPQQCLDAFNMADNLSLPAGYRRFKNIVFSGMGGSAIAADIIRSFCRYRTNYPLSVVRNYRLPQFLNRDSLFFAYSYSGNTEETLACFKEALKKKAKIIAVCSNGRLSALAKRNNIPSFSIPGGYPPRAALGYLFFGGIKIFEKLGIISSLKGEVEETVNLLYSLRNESLSVAIGREGNIAKELACRLKNRFPVIYAPSEDFDAVITRWRSQFAENSKTLSSVNFFPELDHNEIAGWKFPQRVLRDFLVIIIGNASKEAGLKKQIAITKYLLKKDGFKVEEVRPRGKSLMAKIFSLVYIGDFISFYLAILNRVDPTAIKPVDYLKKKLLLR